MRHAVLSFEFRNPQSAFRICNGPTFLWMEPGLVKSQIDFSQPCPKSTIGRTSPISKVTAA
jgi:hypothetical protein